MCLAQPASCCLMKGCSKRRRVLFASENDTTSIPSPISYLFAEDEQSDSWKSDLWYQAKDLAEFREEARNLCRRLTCPDPRPYAGNTRGLEQRLCPERKRRKYISNRCIVYASKKICGSNSWDADRLAALCQKINEWATELAVIEGARDFDRAWREERKRTSEMDQSRCVRQRVSL